MTPSTYGSHLDSPLNTPLDTNLHYNNAFHHIMEFATFVVAQAHHIFRHKFQNCMNAEKPKIPRTFSYNEIVDAQHIAEIAANAMSNPCEFSLPFWDLKLISQVSVPWDSSHYMSQLGPKNIGKNLGLEQDLKRMFPPGPNFSVPKELDTPLTIIDSRGRILVWFLPNLISKSAQVMSR